ncbi:MAG: hypothetical protein ACXW3O_00935 [Brevundimonas sp.]
MSEPVGSTVSPLQSERAAWETPQLARIDLGDAEAGPNPVAPEGAFAFGS